MEASLAEDISFKTVIHIIKFAFLINSENLQQRCEDFLVACHRMDRSVEDLDSLDKDFVFKILESSDIAVQLV